VSAGTTGNDDSARLWRLFPLVRHLSDQLTPLLLRLPVTPNQVTAISLAAGLAGAACFAVGERPAALAGAALLIVCYILDNCDGDIARAKNLSSRFGHYFDSVADWLVDAAFFISLGYGASVALHGAFWLWLGLATAAGATISYGLELKHDLGARRAAHAGAAASPDAAQDQTLPTNRKEAAVYVFRELFRADFCFLVLILAALNATWILLPAGAIGAQVYWLTSLVVGWRRFHV
jgi:phosphatidylglycerophosphate synthase